VDLIRKYLPHAGITTDIIVGFPGETEEEFSETLRFVEEIGFSRIHVFKYSPRKGTPAATMDNQVHGEIKNRRSEALIGLGDRLSEEFNKRYIGSSMDVLYEEHTKRNLNIYEGYTSNYIRVKAFSTDGIIGEIRPTRLEESKGSLVEGALI
jgi:threonylcarbamoyladenosine tRNA methylthiotransferase MtaB